MMKRILFTWAVISAVFTIGWWVYVASKETDAKWTEHLNELSAPGFRHEVQHPSTAGIWVGSVATVVFLVAGAVAGAVDPSGVRRKCPHCAENIAAAAKVCRYCGRDVEPAPARPSKPTDATLPDLLAGLSSADPDVRFRAVTALGDLGAAAAGALADLQPLKGDPDRRVRDRAKWAVDEIERKARKA